MRHLRAQVATRRGSLSLAAILILTVSISASGQSANTTSGQVMYLPVIQSSPGADLGIALSNPTLTNATITLTARDYDGQVIAGTGITNPATMSVPASGQNALRLSEIFGSPIASMQGWVELRTANTSVKGFFMIFDGRVNYIDGAEFPRTPVNRLYFPRVQARGPDSTRLSFINVSATDLEFATISLFTNSGALAARQTFGVPARNGFNGPISDLVPDVTGFDGYAILDAGGTPFAQAPNALVGFEAYRDQTDIAVVNGMSETSLLRSGIVPHLILGGGFRSRLMLINPTAELQTLVIRANALEIGGRQVDPNFREVERDIPANGRLEESISAMFDLPGGGTSPMTGYLTFEVENTGRGVIGFLDYGTEAGTQLAAVPIQTSPYSDIFFSHVSEALNYYTGFAVLNPNNQPAAVNIDISDRAGRRIGSVVMNLKPGERRTRLLADLIHATRGQLGGFVRMTSTRPIFAFQLFGTQGGDVLANVAAQGVVLRPQATGRRVSNAAGANVFSSDALASLAIAPGSLSTDATIRITSIRPSSLPKAATSETLVSAVEGQPAGTRFQIPAKLTFPLAAAYKPGTVLILLQLNAQGNRFDPSEFTAVVDETGRFAVADITHFSTFGIGFPDTDLLSVTSVNPTSGLSGTEVTINGSGFSPLPASNTVTFAGPSNTALDAQITSAGPNQLTVLVPQGAVTGALIVQTLGRSSVGANFVVPTNNPVPSLASISPTGAILGTVASVDLEIIGNGFVPGSSITFNGTPVPTTFLDGQTLFATLTSGQLTAAVHRIGVSNPTPGGGASNTADFTVGFPVPSLSGLTPATAERGTAVQVSISGTNFVPASRVFLDSSAVSTSYVSPTELTATFNSADSGVKRVYVANPTPGGGQSATLTFTFLDPANTAPQVVVSPPSQTVQLPATATLTATAIDDGRPGPLSLTWTKLSGPGTITFTPPNALVTVASFSGGGTYRIRFLASDGQATATADLTVIAQDGQAPVVSITAPPANQLVRGQVRIDVSATDNIGVSNVQFYIDGTTQIGSTAMAPFLLDWDSSTAGDGVHLLTAVAFDTFGNSATSGPVSITIDNTPPVVTMTSPPPGAATGLINLGATATDSGSGIASAQFLLDGQQLGGPITTSGPYALVIDTRNPPIADGAHVVGIIVIDLAGNQRQASVNISVDNSPPTVSIVSPTPGASVRGTVVVTANAIDSAGISFVQLTVDGNNLGGQLANSPFTFSWNTVGVPDGAHVLAASAQDVAGNTANSVTVTITVDNTAPTITFTAPAVVSGTVTLAPVVNDAGSGVDRVQFRLNGANLGAAVTSAPFTFDWNTVGLQNGAATLSAIVTDEAGNTVTAPNVAVIVDNTAPSAVITAPVANLTIAGTVNYSASVADVGSGVAQVEFRTTAQGSTSPVVVGTMTTPTSGNTYTFSWNTAASATNGVNQLTVVATDRAGNQTTSASVSVIISNGVTVSMVSPTSGAVRGNVVLTAAANSTNSAVQSVQFFVDGNPVGFGTFTSGITYTFTWNSTTVSDGSRTIIARMTEVSSATLDSSPVTVSVDNAPPTVTMTSPPANAFVGGVRTITATATDAVGVTNVQFRLDGNNLGAPVTTSTGNVFSFSWNTATTTSGAHTLSAVATDLSGNTATSAGRPVIVDNTPPTVSIALPAPGPVQLVVLLTANAADIGTGLARVQFRVNGVNQGAPVTAPPYQLQWDTTILNNGSYTITAVATDLAGQSTTSAPVAVTLNQFFVSPGGNPSNTGRLNSPWDLQTALCGGPDSTLCEYPLNRTPILGARLFGRTPPQIGPGAAIFLRGGIYQWTLFPLQPDFQAGDGLFTSKLRGSAVSPILIRPYPGESPVIDGTMAANRDSSGNATQPTSVTALVIRGNDVHVTGFEITNSDQNQRFLTRPLNTVCVPPFVPPFSCGESNRGDRRGFAVDIYSPRSKMTNMLIHDAGQGIGLWDPSVDSEVNGNIIFHNGWDASKDGPPSGANSVSNGRLAGHGIYTQNGQPNSTMTVKDNIIFANFGDGFHASGSGSSSVKRYRILGNVHFNDRFIIGGPPVDDIIVRDNLTYNFSQLELGQPNTNPPNSNMQVIDNVLTNGAAILDANDLVFTGNLVVPFASSGQLQFRGVQGKTLPHSSYQFSNNNYFRNSPNPAEYTFTPFRTQPVQNLTFTQWQALTTETGSTYSATLPTGLQIYIKQNDYNPKRFFVVVYNWDRLSTIDIPANVVTGAVTANQRTSGLGFAAGQPYQIRNVQDYFNDVFSGTYNGGPLTLNMANTPGAGQNARTLARPSAYAPQLPQVGQWFPSFAVFEITIP